MGHKDVAIVVALVVFGPFPQDVGHKDVAIVVTFVVFDRIESTAIYVSICSQIVDNKNFSLWYNGNHNDSFSGVQ
ncbi:hypothetical protein [Domibacillus epiphyticus]|uniref:Uncharacterized protein n=1 Tax=Domibacillus epiphyticus TaxID=1714355 RepID=A0A1V2A9L5_9BACI|nr:hypothetical protein [Domibacillus epiphyticus]OMP67532.1 hypothetical protein BTO28_06185 [Domibacillus epiphyticus]